MSKEVLAKAKYVRKTARKARLLVDYIRGKKVEEALDYLKFANKAAAVDVFKVLKSAQANAVNNEQFDKNELYISTAFVNDAPIFKRGRAVARGRYHRIYKRNSHIVIGVSENQTSKKEAKIKKDGKKAEVKKTEVKTEVKEAKKTASKATKKTSSKKVK